MNDIKKNLEEKIIVLNQLLGGVDIEVNLTGEENSPELLRSFFSRLDEIIQQQQQQQQGISFLRRDDPGTGRESEGDSPVKNSIRSWN